jgi:hypothetical protein
MESEADNTLDVLLHAVDIEVIRERSQAPSQTTRTFDNNWLSGMGHVVCGAASCQVSVCTSFLLGGAMRHVFLAFLHRTTSNDELKPLRSGFNSSLETGHIVAKETSKIRRA